jgi:hypothetical protein
MYEFRITKALLYTNSAKGSATLQFCFLINEDKYKTEIEMKNLGDDLYNIQMIQLKNYSKMILLTKVFGDEDELKMELTISEISMQSFGASTFPVILEDIKHEDKGNYWFACEFAYLSDDDRDDDAIDLTKL